MENLDSHGNELQIRNVEYNDSGSYVCMAENVLGKVQKEVTLFVEGEIQPLTRQIHFKSLRCKVTDFRGLPVSHSFESSISNFLYPSCSYLKQLSLISFLVIQIYFFASFAFNLVKNDIRSGSL